MADDPVTVGGTIRTTITAAVLRRLKRGDRIRHPGGMERTLVRRKRPDEMGYPGWQLDDSGGVADAVLIDVEWQLLSRAVSTCPCAKDCPARQGHPYDPE